MRDLSVTIAKGFAIIFIVIGHAGCPMILNKMVTPTAIAVFFFMSGYCFKEKYLSDAKTFTQRRISGIYLPYLKWSLLFLLFHNVFYHLNIYSDEYGFHGRTSVLYTASDYLDKAVSVATKMQGHEQLLGAYWFLKSLFVGSFIFYAIAVLEVRVCGTLTSKLCMGVGKGMLILLFMTVLLSFFDCHLPYFKIGSREFFAATIIYAGYLYRQRQWLWHRRIAVNIIALIAMTAGSQFWFTTMLYYYYWKVLPHTVSITLAVLALLHLSEWISKRKDLCPVRLLIYIGDHTMAVLTWHFLSLKLVSLLLIAIYGLPIKQLSEFPVIEKYAHQGWWLLYFCVGVGVPILWTYCYHRLKDAMSRNNIIE